MFGYSSYVFCKGTLFSSILLSFCLFHDIFIAFLTLLMHDAWGWKVFSLLVYDARQVSGDRKAWRAVPCVRMCTECQGTALRAIAGIVMAYACPPLFHILRGYHYVSCQVMSYVRAFLHKWCLTGWLLSMNGMGEGVAGLPEYGHFFFCFGMSCTISKSSWRFSTLALATFMRTESPSE